MEVIYTHIVLVAFSAIVSIWVYIIYRSTKDKDQANLDKERVRYSKNLLEFHMYDNKFWDRTYNELVEFNEKFDMGRKKVKK